MFLLLGPGLVTGASDDDPSGIGTYAQAGAALGLSSLWTALFTFPMMWSIQFICARIGMITGGGLAQVLRNHYPRWLLYPVVAGLVIANTINAGVDIGAIAAAINLLVPVPIAALIVPIAVAILIGQIWGSYRFIARTFKWLSLALFAYVLSAFFAKPDWSDILEATLFPTLRFDRRFLVILVGILGTTITPYLFFWQANQEVEEELSMGRRALSQRIGATAGELKYANWDVAIGMFFSNLVMYFIILATASTLFKSGQTHIESAIQAAQALRPLAGRAAYLLWAPGLIGAGVLCVPILTGSAAYAMAEALDWTHGLDEKPRRAKLFYGVISLSTLVGMLINFVGVNPMTALFWTAVLNGFLAPPILVVVMLIANNRSVLGEHVNGPVSNAIGWATTAAMCAAAVALVLTWGR
ncbi:MAG TPA: Nramp family divalent metal transporter [Vicinamibacterales bacterium]|nr:Nramp family divalent metal transporter [Vicinamibacterales bacterium]